MEIYDIEKHMLTAVKKISEVGKEYAKAKGLSYQMQEMRKVVLAREMSGVIATSVAQKEIEARASVRYEQHLEGVRQAIEEETRLRAEYERYKAQYEALRTLMSLEKAKANIR